ncbi:MAG TPA: TRIC cation channel family protein, partial [Armatimonadota bacterium]|nr:TRIC cation channel family protein [Armatimonadota bacterium]
MEHPILEFGSVIFALEIIGVIAFAITGALTAIERDMDIFGILVLALITALGGGIIRDILVNRFPVSLLNASYFFATVIGVIITLIIVRSTAKYLLWVKIFDALGLAIFSVLGAQVG